MNRRHLILSLAALSLVTLFNTTAVADPLNNEVLKFLQLPLNTGVPTVLSPGTVIPGVAQYPGHDELSTAWLSTVPGTTYSGTYMADDFSDKVSTPVVHVQWWGSYLNQNAAAQNFVQQFLISFEADVPANPSDPAFPNSHPNPTSPINLHQIVTAGPLAPGSGTFTETALTTGAGATETLYQYNAELALPFNEKADDVYWLKIVALDNRAQNDPQAIQWGWHDRDWGIQNTLASSAPSPGETDQQPNALGIPIWHFQDDAVTGQVDVNTLLPIVPGQSAQVNQVGFAPQNYLDPVPGTNGTIRFIDGPAGIDHFSKDLAFALYTTPEPGTVVLMGFGAVAVLMTDWKRRRRSR